MIKLKDLLTEASLSEEMRELKLFIDNDASIYRQRYIPILKNLSNKKKQGKYRKGLAKKAFMYLIDDGAKRYVKSYGGNARDIFPKRQRQMLAKDYVDEFEDTFKNQEFDFIYETSIFYDTDTATKEQRVDMERMLRRRKGYPGVRERIKPST